MHCDLSTLHASHAPPTRLRSSPIETYRNYRRALRSKDLSAILQNLAGFAAQRVLAFGDARALDGPSLSVWCAMQAEAISKAFGIAVNGDRALVQAGGKHTYCLLHMSRFDTVWRIVAEEHARRRHGALVFESRSLDLFATSATREQAHLSSELRDCVGAVRPPIDACALP